MSGGMAGPFIMPDYLFHCWKCGTDLPQFLIDEGYRCKCQKEGKEAEWVRFSQQGGMRPKKWVNRITKKEFRFWVKA